MSKLAELSQLTELLNEKDEELLNFFELSLDLFCIFGRDGYIKRCNDRWLDATGYSKEELLDRPYVSFFTKKM